MLCTKLESVYRRKLWGDEVVGVVLSGVEIEGVRDDRDDGSEDL